VHAAVFLPNGGIVEVGTNMIVGPNARRIAETGRYLLPRQIDSHVQVSHSAALDDDAIDAHPDLWSACRVQVPGAYLAFGFTTVVDLDLTQRQSMV
jgi:dihydroorotase-like cyclic amidohydrolase